MRIIITLLVLLVPPAASAEEIAITVKGMVCSFCAQGIEKTLGNESSVERVKVDLDKKLVHVSTKQGTTVADDDITRIINDAGYDVVNIERKDS